MRAEIPAPFNQVIKKGSFITVLYWIWILCLGENELRGSLNLCLGFPGTPSGGSV